jgi:anthranilate synthase component 1
MTTILPSLKLDEFDRLAAPGVTVAVHRTVLLDGLTAVGALEALRGAGSPCFLLESATGGERIGRYSFLGFGPTAELSDRGGKLRYATRAIGEQTRELPLEGNPKDILDALRGSLAKVKVARPSGLPRFGGGWVGFCGWDIGRGLLGLPRRADGDRPDGLPDALFYLFHRAVAFDHLRGTVTLIDCATVDAEGSATAWRSAQARLDTLERILAEAAGQGLARPKPVKTKYEPKPLSTREQYEESVRRAKQHIVAGDVFQTVLSRSVELQTDASALSIYRALRAINPSPYLFYLELDGGTTVMGASPELLVRVEDGKVAVRPIAGTRRRGETEAQDRALELELLEDEKERAEHTMLVDLGRNDVGRVAKLGTVSVDELMTVERYSHVMHLVSHVSGQLDPQFDRFDAFAAGFPAGTVSGAPKRRAVELIDELEGARGLYAGAVGYADLAGGLDTCIAIRTLVHSKGKVIARAGAGIVHDSTPDREFEETQEKSRALLEAVRLAEQGLRV